jgi:hypothetical protein
LPVAAGDGCREGGDAKSGDGGIDAVSGRNANSRQKAVKAAPEKGPPKAEKEDRAGGGRHGESQHEAAEQQAGHRDLS